MPPFFPLFFRRFVHHQLSTSVSIPPPSPTLYSYCDVYHALILVSGRRLTHSFSRDSTRTRNVTAAYLTKKCQRMFKQNIHQALHELAKPVDYITCTCCTHRHAA